MVVIQGGQGFVFLWLGDNDLDILTDHTTCLDETARRLLDMRQEIIEAGYTLCFILGYPDRARCHDNDSDTYHRMSLKCNQRFVNSIGGHYIKLPWSAYYDPQLFLPDGVHLSSKVYRDIACTAMARLRGVFKGDADFCHVEYLMSN
ncbi:unnamed protein product [Meganyctiphanes norvegica]|uniref:SGNH hydrolase-type esterase domain-containing protein n=1 Tax=Meganyctiphanes norvegica TaxID=48144 RepID=A0AAV2R623_MEGNR